MFLLLLLKWNCMPKLPVVSGKEALKVAKKLGFFEVRQKGSHKILRNSERKRVIIPMHSRLKPGTFLQILKALNIDKEKFLNLLGKKH